ncbi:ABC transporter substrate-binding protein [Gordonia sp. HY002]|uniref:ABC transporter substrate-binding protein n=1 Tax=Gordonia zhenghanii TaxID=2911516 RepID=UPI001EF0701E|nr:ABC transporter substrate-binding protein [Gordonia zhenghanii]MCF8571950.1 ABC transporter substrate-binding protein [Gordonia zhenghanii]MCF8604168.1 ABC transporter substrate-binding protein [Gordonia zhenghanii]
MRSIASRRRPRRHRKRSAPVAVAALIVVTAAAAGCGIGGTEEEAEPTTIRYQSSAGLINYLEVADALGYLPGLTLDWIGESGGGPASLQALATHQSDIASGPFNGAIAKVVSAGVEVTAVAAAYGSSGDVSSSIVTLDDHKITKGQDLIGKKVAVNTLGANAEAILDTYLKQEGLSDDEIDDVTLVPLPGINAESALRQGQVDASYTAFAAKETAMKHGGLRVLADDVDLVGPYNGGSYVLRNGFIEHSPKTTRALVGGITKAIDYAQRHSTTEVLDLYGKYLDEHDRSDERKSYTSWNGNGIATAGGVLRDQDFSIWLDWLQASGEVDADAVNPSELYTNKFNPFADRKSE